MLSLFFSSCQQYPVDDGSYPTQYLQGPYNISVESITKTTVKISWPTAYGLPVIVERSVTKDSLFSVIQPHDSNSYFYDSNVVAPQKYYYRFRGFTGKDTSYYTTLTISYDSSSMLLQSVSTNKNTSSMTMSDDGTLISVVNPDWGGFEIRRYSDLSLVTTRNRGDLIGNVGSETRFSADANKILTWNFNYATSITLSPYSETALQIPDSIGFYDMYYIVNDTKILVLASTYQSQRPFVYVFDLQTKTFVQQIDTLQDSFFYETSYVSNDRSKVIIQTSVGFSVITISPSLSIKDLLISSSYERYTFQNKSNNVIAVGYTSFAFINSGTGAIYKSVATNVSNSFYRMAVYPDDSRIITFDSYARDVSIYNLSTGVNEQRVGGVNPDITVTGVCCSKSEQSFIILYNNGTINKYSTVNFVRGWQKKDGN
jgi:hypothetical protein